MSILGGLYNITNTLTGETNLECNNLTATSITATTITLNNNDVQTEIDTAQYTANNAISDAANAQSTANNAVSDAANAQSTANTALATGSSAFTLATAAGVSASAAQATATTALTTATAAQITANDAAFDAETALSRTQYISTGGSYPTGYTTFNAAPDLLTPTGSSIGVQFNTTITPAFPGIPYLQNNMFIGNDGQIQQYYSGATNTLLDTTFNGDVNLTNTLVVNGVSTFFDNIQTNNTVNSVSLKGTNTTIGATSSTTVVDGQTITIGNPVQTSSVAIEGSTINIGTFLFGQTINIGGPLSFVNISCLNTQPIQVANFFDQLP